MPAYRPAQHPTWYCRRDNVVLGPVSTKVLHHYLYDGTLGEQDAGRVGLDGEWIAVHDLRRMFEEDGFVRPSAKRTPGAAAEVLEKMAHAPHAVPRGRSVSWLSRQFGFVVDVADSFSGRIADITVGAASHLMSGLRLRVVQVVLACLVLGGAVWGVVLPNWPLSAEDELLTYRSLLGEMTALVGTDAGPSEWDAIGTRLTQQIEDTGPRIRASATSLRPDFQNLMWAIDLFPKALAEARSGDIPKASVLAMVDRHLEQADRFIRRQETLALRNARKEPEDNRNGKLIAAILTPVIAGAALYWRRRRIRLRS